MTQFVVETLTVILFLLAFYGLPMLRVREKPAAGGCGTRSSPPRRGALMTSARAGGHRRAHARRVSATSSSAACPTAHGRNVVNVILVDFRALDTLGEIACWALAGIGVYRAAPKLRPRRGRRADELPDPAHGLGTPLLFDVGVYLLVAGVRTLMVLTLAEE
jgi:multicomponent Na+:H+ antiporter subunit A